jgi:glycosyltransferase involved in cell wall biosynthesis
VDLKDQVYSQLDRWSLGAADHVVTVCNAFARDLQRIGVPHEKIAVRHNSVKPFCVTQSSEVAAIRRSLGIPSDTAVLLAAGRLSPEKGHFDLIEAVAHLRSNAPRKRFRLLIAGDGPERMRLENRVRQLGIVDFVMLIGHQQDLRPYYTMADIMILPSHSEGSPNVLLESMAAGLPAVATNVGGIPEIARDGQTALLVEKSDIDAMSHAIARLLSEPELRVQLGENAKRLSCTYRAEDYCDSMVKLYSTLLIRRGSS